MKTSFLVKPALIIVGVVTLFGCLGCDTALLPEVDQFTLTYNGNGNESGSLPADPTKYEVDEQVTVLGNTGNLARSGYEFSGWNTKADGSGTGYVAGDVFEMPAQDVTLFAMWQAVASSPATYGVAYTAPNATGGTPPADSNAYEQGDTVTVLDESDLARTGYTFAGWSDGSTTYAAGDTFSMPADDVQLAAVWDPITYSITYNLDGGSNDAANPATYTIEDTPITLQPASKADYTFNGWYTESTFTNKVTEIAAGSTGDITLYAEFTLIPTYNVTYSAPNADGGTVPSDSADYQEGETVTVLGNTGSLTRDGYTFAGWSDGTTTYAAGDTFTMGTADVTLSAVWDPITYSITYNLDGGSNDPANPATYTVEDTSITLEPATKDDYNFNGWYTESTFTNKVTEIATGTTGNISLYAKFTLIPTYNVTYSAPDATSGTAPSDSTAYQEGDTVTVAGNTGSLTRDGYTFAGWSDGTTTYAAGDTFTMGTADVTLSAVWDLVTYSITYNLDGGSNDPANPTSYTVEDSTITLQPASKVDHTFEGWYTEDTFATEVTEIPAGSTGNVSLYAKFTLSTALIGGTVEKFTPAVTINVYAYASGTWDSSEIAGGFTNAIAGPVSATTTDTAGPYTYTYSGLEVPDNASYDFVAVAQFDGQSYGHVQNQAVAGDGTVTITNNLTVSGRIYGLYGTGLTAETLVYDPADVTGSAADFYAAEVGSWSNALYGVVGVEETATSSHTYTVHVPVDGTYDLVGASTEGGFVDDTPDSPQSVTVDATTGPVTGVDFSF